MEYQIYRGDVVEVLKDIPDETYTCVLTDPPYGLSEQPDMAEVLAHWLAGDDYKHTQNGFMGKGWDSFVPGPSVWKEVYRVCKPGAVLMAFGGTRTFDLLSIALRLAGFEMYDVIMYMYGSGFNKVGYIKNRDGTHAAPGHAGSLKPAYEPVLLCRRPRTKTYAQHAVEDGTGALNIDGCKVQYQSEADKDGATPQGRCVWKPGRLAGDVDGVEAKEGNRSPQLGRWPANIIHDGSDEVAEVFARAGERTSGAVDKRGRTHKEYTSTVAVRAYDNPIDYVRESSGGTAARFFQVCPQDHPDAARFFYASKASRRERNAGLEGMEERVANTMDIGEDTGRDSSRPSNAVGGQQRRIERGLPPTAPRANHHPCIKPLSLCEYLARLILPPVEYREDARLLVPFCGSGSEMVGALLAGWLNIDGIDKDEDEHGNPLGYVEIARRRLDWWHMMKRQTRLSDPAEILARVYPQDVEETNDDPAFDDLPLFADLS